MPEVQPISFAEHYTIPWPYFRLAEMYLNYAEAKFELGDEATCRTYINKVRARAGVNMPPIPNTVTGEALRQRLYNERRIELAFENQRWYDIRRWKILDEGLQDAKGVDITETITNGNSVTVWKQIPVETRKALQKMYWVPIASDEIRKAPQLEQNPEY